MIQVWADVGGTFTDCFIVRAGARDDRESIKVLSSGATKGRVHPDSSPQCIFDPQRRDDPADFWNGFAVRLLDTRGEEVASSVVERFDAATASLHLQTPLTVDLAGLSYEMSGGLEAPVLAARRLLRIPLSEQLPPLDVRLGTTRGTNALLTRHGATTALVTTQGFGDLLEIGEQDRPDLFALEIIKPTPLTNIVVELDERLAADGTVLRSLDDNAISQQLRPLLDAGVESLAICLLHAYKNPRHEQQVARVARETGFREISLSSEVAPLIKLVARAETTTLDAYLNPILSQYVRRVWQQFGGHDTARLRLMTSGGALVPAHQFRGRDSVLSGPAGGVVGLAAVARAHAIDRGAIGLDMGGTSTDVSRFDEHPRRQYEARKAGIRVMTPMMAIETVAAGGGSICWLDGQRLQVGPDSAGSEPGPACYGRGGPLTVTDLNLILGRIDPARFPFPLNRQAAVERLEAIRSQLELTHACERFDSTEKLAEGFWKIAVNHMAEAVRTVSTADGADPRPMTLVGFGGAAGQHLTAVADVLEMTNVLDHPDASMLSALGMGLADIGQTRSLGIYRRLETIRSEELAGWQAELDQAVERAFAESFTPGAKTRAKWTADLRYQGTESTLEITLVPFARLADRFTEAYRQAFGYVRTGVMVELVALRLERVIASKNQLAEVNPVEPYEPQASTSEPKPLFVAGQWCDSAQWERRELHPGAGITGPALIIGENSTLVVEPNWTANVCSDGTIRLTSVGTSAQPNQSTLAPAQSTASSSDAADPVLVEILGRRLQGIADAMGEVLRRTAVSVNVKERRDYSCAMFRHDGSLVANAPHVPVHLGAMGHTVRRMIQQFPEMSEGDCFVSNDPYSGGSHLPDVTVVTPVFATASALLRPENSTGLNVGQRPVPGQPDFFVASRAHHAEIGGITPGSMPPNATSLAEEGVVIRDFALVRSGVSYEDDLRQVLSSGRFPSRLPEENLADIRAQQAAGLRGVRDLQKLSSTIGAQMLDRYMAALQQIASDAVQPIIAKLASRRSSGSWNDTLDDGTTIAVQVTPLPDAEKLRIDFAGTDGVHPYGFNATPAIVTAAVLYVLRCQTDRPIPLNEGMLQPIDLRIPTGLLNPAASEDPHRSPAVVAGNVETSQRIVDVLLAAFDVAAASQGTMNNVLIGDESFGYYETICGGAGATASSDGASAVHTHMTNTRITDPEIFESRYPVRLWEFSVRRNSGGTGRFRGGDGVIRQWEFLKPLTLSLLTGRRPPHRPFGMHGGQPGKSGRNQWVRVTGEVEALPSSVILTVAAGDRLRMETPGGGGWGNRSKRLARRGCSETLE